MSNAETYFRFLVNEIHTTIVATVDDDGLPVTAAIDMMDYLPNPQVYKDHIRSQRDSFVSTSLPSFDARFLSFQEQKVAITR